jgi:hypothetical protein
MTSETIKTYFNADNSLQARILKIRDRFVYRPGTDREEIRNEIEIHVDSKNVVTFSDFWEFVSFDAATLKNFFMFGNVVRGTFGHAPVYFRA